MKELTFKQKMELYDDLVRKKEIIVSRIQTFEHIMNSRRQGGRDYSIYYMSSVFSAQHGHNIHKDFRHKLNEHDLKDLYDFAEMRMEKLIKEKDEINEKIRELENN